MGKKAAGFWMRVAANLLDGIILGIPLVIISLLINNNFGDILTDILGLLYSMILPIIWHGYTVGKKICGIKIVKVNGGKLGIGTMLLRYLVAGIIYGITFGICLLISAIMIGVRKDKRGIHDFIAGTQVIHDK